MKNKINSCSFGADEITSHFVTGLYTDKLKTPSDSVACRTFKTSRLKGDHRCLSYCQNWILIPDYFISSFTCLFLKFSFVPQNYAWLPILYWENGIWIRLLCGCDPPHCCFSCCQQMETNFNFMFSVFGQA